MMELLLVASGFAVGWFLREWYAMRKIDKLIDSMNDNLLDEIKKKIIDVVVEKEGDVFFVYRKDDRSFLAQGSDINKLSDILTEKFPGMLFNVSPKDLEALESTSK